MSDLISREYMKSLGATCIATRSKDGNMFPIVAIDELPPADLTHEPPSNTLDISVCVDKQAVIDQINRLINDKHHIKIGTSTFRDGVIDGYARVLSMVNRLPSVQPRKGKWHGKGDSEGFGIFICDNCGKFAMMEYDFCPNCGADMRPQFEEPEINPCRGCEDYDGKGGCKTKGGCADRRGDLGD